MHTNVSRGYGGDVLEPTDALWKAGAQGKDWQSRAHSMHVHMPAGELPPPMQLMIAEMIHPYNAIK